jgi:hypothetical protein
MKKTEREARRAERHARLQDPNHLHLLIKDAWAIVAGLGQASKMPGWTYGLSANDCKVGRKLVLIEGSACEGCFALQVGVNYQFANVKECHARRLASLAHPRWVEAMITLIRRKCKKEPFFRWHDSGDVQSMEHLLMIIAVAFACPDVNFWLPTQEHHLLWTARKQGFDFPTNLVIRESAPKKDIQAKFGRGPISSQTKTGVIPEGAYECPAPTQDNNCGPCRACWNPEVPWVIYHFHKKGFSIPQREK